VREDRVLASLALAVGPAGTAVRAWYFALRYCFAEKAEPASGPS